MSIVEMHAAGGWSAAMQTEDDSGIEVLQLVCWALTNDGEIVGVVACGDATHEVTDFSNFLGYVPPGEDAGFLYGDLARQRAEKHAEIDRKVNPRG